MFETTDDHAKIVAKLDEGEKAVIVRAGDTFWSVVKQIRGTAISFDLSSHRPASVDLLLVSLRFSTLPFFRS